MPDSKNKTNKGLLLLSMLMCVGTGALITQSSSIASPLASVDGTEIVSKYVAESNSAEASKETAEADSSDTKANAESSDTLQPSEVTVVPDAVSVTDTPEPDAADVTVTPEVTEPIPTETPIPTPTEAASSYSDEVSPEASRGSWSCTSSDGYWYYLVDGTAYHGWLHDTDGEIYYFAADGHMVTGAQTIDGQEYLFDLDGVLQN